MTEPTAQDRENFRRRQEIADKQNATWQEAHLIALGTLGPGWQPWMKLCLIDSDHRRSGDTQPVATVFKVYRGELKLTERSMFLRRMPDGTIAKSSSPEPLFGDLLEEKHPTRTIEVKGQKVPVGRYELVWEALERYEPRSPEALAAARVTRERNKVIKEQSAFERDYPLLAEIERLEAEEGRGR